MKNVLILNAHHYYPFSEGKLNAALIEKADAFFKQKAIKLVWLIHKTNLM